jgi:hypothetical protein
VPRRVVYTRRHLSSGWDALDQGSSPDGTGLLQDGSILREPITTAFRSRRIGHYLREVEVEIGARKMSSLLRRVSVHTGYTAPSPAPSAM